MANMIHPTAIVDPKAELGADVEIGPHAIIEAGVVIGDRTRVGPLAHIQGTTVLGPDNVIYTGATLGFPPQYLGFSGAPTRLEIGARNVIREYTNIHRGLNDQSTTTIGDDNFLMGFSHVAHDCHVGNRVIIANGALLAGHVTVGDRAFISGNVAIHQFCRVGRLAMIGGLTKVTQDVPPFVTVDGSPARIRMLNQVGLKRADVPLHARLELRRVFKSLFMSGMNLTQALDAIRPADHCDEVREFLEFFRTSKRGVIPSSQMQRRSAAAADEGDE